MIGSRTRDQLEFFVCGSLRNLGRMTTSWHGSILCLIWDGSVPRSQICMRLA